MNWVGLKLSTIRDTDLCIQDDRLSWMKLIEGDDHRLTKAVFHLVDQRCDGYLILLWTYTRYLLNAFGWFLKIDSTSMAELIQATKVYYSTVEVFLTSDLLLLNLRRMAGHITRERDIYNFAGGQSCLEKWAGMCRHSDEWPLGGVLWKSRGAPSCY